MHSARPNGRMAHSKLNHSSRIHKFWEAECRDSRPRLSAGAQLRVRGGHARQHLPLTAESHSHRTPEDVSSAANCSSTVRSERSTSSAAAAFKLNFNKPSGVN
jgi:hypothetical protein